MAEAETVQTVQSMMDMLHHLPPSAEVHPVYDVQGGFMGIRFVTQGRPRGYMRIAPWPEESAPNPTTEVQHHPV